MKATTVWDAITGLPYLIEYALAAMMTPGTDKDKPYDDGRMAVMMQATVDKRVLAKFESANSKICLYQTIADIVSWPWYLVMVSRALLETDEFLEHQ